MSYSPCSPLLNKCRKLSICRDHDYHYLSPSLLMLFPVQFMLLPSSNQILVSRIIFPKCMTLHYGSFELIYHDLYVKFLFDFLLSFGKSVQLSRNLIKIWFRLTSRVYKIGLIKCLFYRASVQARYPISTQNVIIQLLYDCLIAK